MYQTQRSLGFAIRYERLDVLLPQWCHGSTLVHSLSSVHMAGQNTANSAWTCIDQRPTHASTSCASHQQIHGRKIHMVLMASSLLTVWHVKTAIYMKAVSEVRRGSLALWELPTVGMLDFHLQPSSIEQREKKRNGPAESWTSTGAPWLHCWTRPQWSPASARFGRAHFSVARLARSTRSTKKQSSTTVDRAR